MLCIVSQNRKVTQALCGSWGGVIARVQAAFLSVRKMRVVSVRGVKIVPPDGLVSEGVVDEGGEGSETFVAAFL